MENKAGCFSVFLLWKWASITNHVYLIIFLAFLVGTCVGK